MKNLFAKIAKVQEKLFVPKTQTNNHGHYNYRSCEDILVAVKPLLQEVGLMLMLTDHEEVKNDKNYIEAEAMVVDLETGNTFSSFGWAREADTLAGMSPSQITGAASSYARKYALNGLFAIDNTKDADHDDCYDPKYHGQTQSNTQAVNQPQQQAQLQTVKMELTTEQLTMMAALKDQIRQIGTRAELKSLMAQHKDQPYFPMLRNDANARYAQLK